MNQSMANADCSLGSDGFDAERSELTAPIPSSDRSGYKTKNGIPECLFGSFSKEETGALKEPKLRPPWTTYKKDSKVTSSAETSARLPPPSSMANFPAYLDDYKLVQKALSDLKAAEVVLRRVYPKIYEVVRLTAGCRFNPDDIAQLAAMEVLRCLDRYQGRGSIEAWATKIAYRKAARVTKRQWKKEKPMLALIEEDIADTATLDPEKSMSRQQLFDNFLSKMSKIPSKRRVPLFLHLIYGYTVKEVSELTDAPFNTVKDRLKTAIREFQSVMAENESLVTAMLEEMP